MGETFPTTVNSPGNAYMIHLQGCSLGCKNCFNPESWSFKKKKLVNVEELSDRIFSKKPDSLTISGGEPFLQSESLLYFLKHLHKHNSRPFPKGILIYSGFTRAELEGIKEFEEIMEFISCIVSGRYVQELRVYDSLLSSSNQEFIWGTNGLIKHSDVNKQNYEVIVEENTLKLTGFPPEWNKNVKNHLSELGIEIKNVQ